MKKTTFTAKLRKTLSEALQEELENVERNPRGYVLGLVNDALADLRRQGRDALLEALGVEKRFGHYEIRRGGPLAESLRAELKPQIEVTATALVSELQLTPAQLRELRKAAQSVYADAVYERVRVLIGEKAAEYRDETLLELLEGMEKGA